MRYLATLLVASFFVFGTTYAMAGDSTNSGSSSMQQETHSSWAFADWDTNNDGQLSKEEFQAGYEETTLFNDWDVNDDGVLDEDEFSSGLYETWDYDGNGYLEEEEIEEHGFWDW